MAQQIKNVVLMGAGGTLGTHVLKALLEAKFNVSVLTRQSSKAAFPSTVRVFQTDYSESSLVEILTGHDAVVSTVGGGGLKQQQQVIDAAVRAGVKRFIPSEYGIDVCHPKAIEIVPFFAGKKQINDYLRSKQGEGLEWTSIGTGPFLDWVSNRENFKFHLGRLVLTTTMRTIGKAIASVLVHSAETVNKNIWVQQFRTNQKELLEILEGQTDSKWNATLVPADEMIATGRHKLSNGQGGVFQLLQAAMFKGGCGSDFETEYEVHNGLLGLPTDDLKKTVADILVS
ncbi:hypothetical protein GGI43DRAFT_429196 [Trichoderma evansii]